MQGLAYSIGGGWDVSPVDRPGLFVAEASTAYPAQLLDLLTSSLQVWGPSMLHTARSAGAVQGRLACAAPALPCLRPALNALHRA